MAKPELGEKRTCPECGARFYDLNKSPAQCPKCATSFTPEDPFKPKRAKAPKAAETKEDEAPAVPKADKEVSLEEAEAEQAPAKRAWTPPEGESDDEEDSDDLGEIEDVDFEVGEDDTLIEDDDDAVVDIAADKEDNND